MDLTEAIVRNAQQNERTLLVLVAFHWTYLAFEDTQKEDWVESKNVKWNEWRGQRELDCLWEG